jgi:hypothetical protein
MVGSPNARMVITATIAAEIARTCVISRFSLNSEDASIGASKKARYTGKPPSIRVRFRRISAKGQYESGWINAVVEGIGSGRAGQLEQVRATMFGTTFVLLGIEGPASRSARSQTGQHSRAAT